MKKTLVIITALVLTLCLLASCAAPAAPAASEAAAPAAAETPAAPAATEAPAAPAATEAPAAPVEEAPEAPAVKEIPKITLGWAPSDVTGVFAVAAEFMDKAVQDAKANGIDVEVITKTMNDQTQAQDQVVAIEALITQGCDAILTCPADVEAIKPVVNQAAEKGIPVIIVNLLEEQEGMDAAAYIGFDNTVGGKISGYACLDALGGPGVLGEGEMVEVPPADFLDLKKWEEIYSGFDFNSLTGTVAILDGIAGNFYTTTRSEGFRSIVEMCPNIEIVAEIAADWSREKAVTATENILQANPELDVVWGMNTEMAIGASTAVANKGRTGQTMVLSNDGTTESMGLIDSGALLAETWHGFAEWGWDGVREGVMLSLGLPVERFFDTSPRTVYKGNISEFYPTITLPSIDWQAIIAEYEAS